VWIYFLAGAVYQGIAIGHVHNPPGAVTPFASMEGWLFVLPFFFILSSVGVFLINRKRPAYTGFAKRLRPTALMMSFALMVGVVGLASTYAHEQSSQAYFISAFFLTCGLGLLLAHFLSSRFPPRLY
jgi:hypothetical protein